MRDVASREVVQLPVRPVRGDGLGEGLVVYHLRTFKRMLTYSIKETAARTHVQATCNLLGFPTESHALLRVHQTLKLVLESIRKRDAFSTIDVKSDRRVDVFRVAISRLANLDQWLPLSGVVSVRCEQGAITYRRAHRRWKGSLVLLFAVCPHVRRSFERKIVQTDELVELLHGGCGIGGH